jgi:N-acetylneuraminic acid mutarotase
VYNDLWVYDLQTNVWSRLVEEAPAPERCNHAMVSLGSKLIVHGGDGIHALSDLWLYDSDGEQWTALTADGPNPGPRTAVI